MTLEQFEQKSRGVISKEMSDDLLDLASHIAQQEREACRGIAIKIKQMHENKSLYAAALAADQVAIQIEMRNDDAEMEEVI